MQENQNIEAQKEQEKTLAEKEYKKYKELAEEMRDLISSESDYLQDYVLKEILLDMVQQVDSSGKYEKSLIDASADVKSLIDYGVDPKSLIDAGVDPKSLINAGVDPKPKAVEMSDIERYIDLKNFANYRKRYVPLFFNEEIPGHYEGLRSGNYKKIPIPSKDFKKRLGDLKKELPEDLKTLQGYQKKYRTEYRKSNEKYCTQKAEKILKGEEKWPSSRKNEIQKYINEYRIAQVQIGTTYKIPILQEILQYQCNKLSDNDTAKEQYKQQIDLLNNIKNINLGGKKPDEVKGFLEELSKESYLDAQNIKEFKRTIKDLLESPEFKKQYKHANKPAYLEDFKDYVYECILKLSLILATNIDKCIVNIYGKDNDGKRLFESHSDDLKEEIADRSNVNNKMFNKKPNDFRDYIKNQMEASKNQTIQR